MCLHHKGQRQLESVRDETAPGLLTLRVLFTLPQMTARQDFAAGYHAVSLSKDALLLEYELGCHVERMVRKKCT
jgi:hypothetical protein